MIAWYSVDADNHVNDPDFLDTLVGMLQETEAGVVSAVSADDRGQFIQAHGIARVEGKLVGVEVRRKPNGGWTVVFATPVTVATGEEVVG
jgi:hypothetical protein